MFRARQDARTLNEAFCSLAERRRYEVWFLRMGLADGNGAWWFRYLLTNPGRGGCTTSVQTSPVQIWATWFPTGEKPRTYIQEFPLSQLEISRKNESPFHFKAGVNEIGEDFCCGNLSVDGHSIAWNLRYASTFRFTMSNKGWIGFSRSPHSDAVFSGEIALDGRTFSGNLLGFGVQGHNCGYRHRNFWRWTHAYFSRDGHPATTLEALVYEMPFGLVFRKAVVWHDGEQHIFRTIREKDMTREPMQWDFEAVAPTGLRLRASIDGGGPSLHRLPYVKTDCSGTFEVANNSLSAARIFLEKNGTTQELSTRSGAVLEIVG